MVTLLLVAALSFSDPNNTTNVEEQLRIEKRELDQKIEQTMKEAGDYRAWRSRMPGTDKPAPKEEDDGRE